MEQTKLDQELLNIYAESDMIHMVKGCRDRTGLGLVEALRYCESLVPDWRTKSSSEY
jgi:ribosomal protein L7/L12